MKHHDSSAHGSWLCVWLRPPWWRPRGFAADDEAGFKTIFNGKDLEGWDGNPKFWSVKDGTITGTTTSDNPTSGNTFLIYRPQSGRRLRAPARLQDRRRQLGHSVSQQGSRQVGHRRLPGRLRSRRRLQRHSLRRTRPRNPGHARAERSRSTKAGKKTEQQVGDAKEIGSKIKKEDWNTYDVIAQGNHLIHKINGDVTAEVIDGQKERRRHDGPLALQLHAGPPMQVQFKNIRIKTGKSAEAAKVG